MTAEILTQKINKHRTSSNDEVWIVVDLFCGAGGVTEGIENATHEGEKIAHVVACINHDPLAIQSHSNNHPDAVHFVEDVRKVNMRNLASLIAGAKAKYPNAKLALWASLECTFFSKARNGPKNANSRSLAEVLYNYEEALSPDFILIENVEDVKDWGPLNTAGKPIPELKGTLYRKWRENLKSRGYTYESRVLNCADYGAHTSRKRYFAIFAKQGLRITWPRPTHSKKGVGGLKPWKPVIEALDLEFKGVGIFDRKKPLVENTLRRIYAGLEKFVNEKSITNAFISKYYSGKPQDKNISIDGPSGTITPVDHHALVSLEMPWIVKYLSNNPKTGINKGVSVEEPCHTIAAQPRLALAQAEFLIQYYGNSTVSSTDEPINTLTTKGRFGLVTTDIQWLHNPQYGCSTHSLDKPCFTLIARMDKAPPYLVSTMIGSEAYHEISPDDSPWTIKLKEYMNKFGIKNVYLRMLTIDERKLITGFPKSYRLAGTKADQARFIGNAVPCIVPQRIFESLWTGNVLM